MKRNYCRVKESLQQIIMLYLRSLPRTYFQFVLITLPVFFIFGLITGYLDVGGKTGCYNSFTGHRNALLFYTSWFAILVWL